MPCSNDGAAEAYERERDKEFRRLTASLCAILRVAETNDINLVLGQVDWQEAGVTREWLVGWWAEHKRADEARKIREARERFERTQREANRIKALSKLTPEERAALGIK